ncbi:MAG: arginyltransferase [Thermodesulfobacteriota bacterium]
MFSEKTQPFLDSLNQHLQDFTTHCPYGLDHKAVYRMARFGMIPEDIMELLLAAGYRRYGNTIYTMCCEGCRGCVPIKLKPAEFSPNRNQRRTTKKNSDLIVEITDLNPDEEQISLLQKFFDSRYPGKHNTAKDYYAGFFLNSSNFTCEIHYKLEERLVGVAVTDLGSTWMNAVYFYFDPEYASRSPGTFNILHQIELCRKLNIDNLYLGYWIETVEAMNYKASFLPHYLLEKEDWRRVSADNNP